MFERLHVLSESDCRQVRAVVYDLRHQWIRRNIQFPFFTLSTASYLDAAAPGTSRAYCEMAVLHNPILKSRFGWLYNRVQEALAEHLGSPATYCEPFALPGFHIFLADQLFRKSVASVHCDLQYQLLDWGPPEFVDFSRPLSFTLAISLPSSGAGLNLWDLQQQEVAGLSSWQYQVLIETRRKTHIPYEVGSMVLHSGHNVHQIAPMIHAEPGDERITLQGHAIWCQGAWQIYW